MSKKLYYFDFNGLGEFIRYILHYGGQDFEDIRVRNWMELKYTLPYGQVPVYEEGGRRLNQSIAIARYVGSQVGLVPADPWEQAVLDATVLTINDFRLKLRQNMRPEYLAEIVEYYFSRFENELKNNNGHFGGTLSWADFYFVGILDTVSLPAYLQIEINYPTIVSLVKKVKSLPGVKEYIASKKHYGFD